MINWDESIARIVNLGKSQFVCPYKIKEMSIS